MLMKRLGRRTLPVIWAGLLAWFPSYIWSYLVVCDMILSAHVPTSKVLSLKTAGNVVRADLGIGSCRVKQHLQHFADAAPMYQLDASMGGFRAAVDQSPRK
jgi:hypothetical protein